MLAESPPCLKASDTSKLLCWNVLAVQMLTEHKIMIKRMVYMSIKRNNDCKLNKTNQINETLKYCKLKRTKNEYPRRNNNTEHKIETR